MASSLGKKLAITSPTSGGRFVGIVRSRTQTMEFSLVLALLLMFMSMDAILKFKVASVRADRLLKSFRYTRANFFAKRLAVISFLRRLAL
jgi:hypothetical protein